MQGRASNGGLSSLIAANTKVGLMCSCLMLDGGMSKDRGIIASCVTGPDRRDLAPGWVVCLLKASFQW